MLEWSPWYREVEEERPRCSEHPEAKVVVSSLRNFLYCKVCKKILKEGDCDETAS